MTVRLIFRPGWDEVASAVGGGPVLIRNGGPVFRSFEAFGAEHLLPRNPRTAVGQLADGRILLVVTDGRQPGYSVGMTNFELAQTMQRLGAVRASALDARRLDDARLRRPAAQQPVRRRRTGRRELVDVPVLRRARRAAGPAGRVAERRRRRRAPDAGLQAGPAVVRHRDADRPGRRRRVERAGRAGARPVPGRLPGRAAAGARRSHRARRGRLAAEGRGGRRPGADLGVDPAVHGEQHAVRAAVRPRPAGRARHAGRRAFAPA